MNPDDLDVTYTDRNQFDFYHHDPDEYNKWKGGVSLPEHLVEDVDDLAAKTATDRSRTLALILQDYFYLLRHNEPRGPGTDTVPDRIRAWEAYHQGQSRNKPNR